MIFSCKVQTSLGIPIAMASTRREKKVLLHAPNAGPHNVAQVLQRYSKSGTYYDLIYTLAIFEEVSKENE